MSFLFKIISFFILVFFSELSLSEGIYVLKNSEGTYYITEIMHFSSIKTYSSDRFLKLSNVAKKADYIFMEVKVENFEKNKILSDRFIDFYSECQSAREMLSYFSEINKNLGIKDNESVKVNPAYYLFNHGLFFTPSDVNFNIALKGRNVSKLMPVDEFILSNSNAVVDGVETNEFRMKLYEEMIFKDICNIIDNKKKINEQKNNEYFYDAFTETENAWVASDNEKLSALAIKQLCGSSDKRCFEYDYVGRKRNEAMADRIISIISLNKKINLIMLGAGHLHSNGGVLDILRKKGINFAGADD